MAQQLPVAAASGTRRAVFLDRDGTLIREVRYLHSADQIEFLAGAFQALRLLGDAGFLTVLVTNQSAVGRGLIEEADLVQIHQRLQEQLLRERVPLDALYYCPHAPGKSLSGGRPGAAWSRTGQIDDPGSCSCRKPLPGMLLEAASDLGISLPDSFMIGDSLRDVEAGNRAGCTALLVRTGRGTRERRRLLAAEGESRNDLLPHPLQAPAIVVEDLLEAAFWIRERVQ